MRFLAVLILGITLSSPAPAQSPGPSLSVTGTGEVAAAPDMATITLGVTSQAKSARAAMDETSARVAAILGALRAAGIEGRDLQTRNLSLQPVWRNRAASLSGSPEIDGFVASNTVMVRVRALDRLGSVLDRVLAQGANSFQGLQFGLQEPGPAMDAARRDAVAEAMRKARLYAEAAGLELGPVLSLSESGGVAPRPLLMEAARMSADVPVEGGEVSVRASVTMVFAIGQ